MPGTSNFILNGSISTLTQEEALAAGGKVFVVNCQTPGTAIAYAALTTFSATANGMFVIRNTNPAGGPNIYIRRLELFQTASVATGTTWSFETYNETGLVAGTTAVITRTPVQINQGVSQTTGAIVQAFNAGAITIPAAVGTRVLTGQGWIPIGVNVVKDVYTMDFGSDSPAASKTGLTAARATDVGRLTGQMPACIIPPQTTSWINMWGCGSSAPSFEYNLTYYEL